MSRGIRRRLYAGIFVVFLGVIFGWTPVSDSRSWGVLHAEALNNFAPGYDGWESQYEYINLDTVWHKADTLVFDKPVLIDNNATLTIEAGAQVRFNGGGIDVNWGNIIASGTESEPITLTSDNAAPFTITFVDYEEAWEGQTGKTSLLQYVDIKSGGSYSDPDTCGTMSYYTSFFINTASAAGKCAWGTAAVRYMSGRVTIEHANFIGNNYADILVDGSFFDFNRTDFLHVSFSNFGNNVRSTAVLSQAYCSDDLSHEECSQRVVMQNNWWGAMSGPQFQTSAFEAPNTGGMGNRIDGNGTLLFRPFATESFAKASATVDCIENCFSNVLFLPGVEASRLYAHDDANCTLINCENQLWEPNRNEDAKKLYLNTDGKSTDAYDIYTRDVLDETDIAGQNIYKSFIATMNAMKNDDHFINDWQAVPYDWRLSLEDILNGGVIDGENISYNGASIAPHIVGELKRLAASSRTGKVTIVTHSNGGLVAKALMQKIGDDETQKLIDEVVMVGVPQIGTPIAIGAMLHGYDQSLLSGLLLSKSTARGLAEYMSAAYTLLPSDDYFSAVGAPVVTFDADKLPEWSAKYGDAINSQEGMRNFLIDAYKRVDATSNDMEAPTNLHTNLLDAAMTRHDAVDAWVAPAGVKVVQIAGWGVPVTVSGMHYTTETKYSVEGGASITPYEKFVAEPVFTVDGDGTVVTPSALWMGDAERYWVDINQYNKRHPLTTLGGYVGPEHSNILEISELNTFIANLIIHGTKSIDNYVYMTTQAPSISGTRLQYSLHSPLSLNLTDDQGRHTGLDADGNIEEQIPGTYYRQFGEVKYIFADELAPLHLSMDGYAPGTFTLEVEELRGDTSVGKVTFKDVPTTTETKVVLDTSDGLLDLSALQVDEDGDGTQEFQLQPTIGEVTTFDVTAPVTTQELIGTLGIKDWYTSDVSVSLSAVDEESGVSETRYSLDKGETWSVYTEPLLLNQEGATQLAYFSVNTQGYREDEHIITIKIDKTAPEAHISFNPLTQQIEIIGTDNLSTTVSVATTDTVNEHVSAKYSKSKHDDRDAKIGGYKATLIDEAGHITVLTFVPEKNDNVNKDKDEEDKNHVSMTMSSIEYDGVMQKITTVSLDYRWKYMQKNQIYVAFSSTAKDARIRVLSEYRAKRDITTIREKSAKDDTHEHANDDYDTGDSGEGEFKKTLPGMVILSLGTNKGSVNVVY